MPRKCCIPNCKLQQDNLGCLSLGFCEIPRDDNLKEKWLNSILKNFGENEKIYLTRNFSMFVIIILKKNVFIILGPVASECCSRDFIQLSFQLFKARNSTQTKVELENEVQNSTNNVNVNADKSKLITENNISDSIILNNEDYNLLNIINEQLPTIMDSRSTDALINNSNESIVLNPQTTIHAESKSLIDLDVMSLDDSDSNLIKAVLLKAQVDLKANREIIANQDKKISDQTRCIKKFKMKVYRQNKNKINIRSQMIPLKKGNIISGKDSSFLKVSVFLMM